MTLEPHEVWDLAGRLGMDILDTSTFSNIAEFAQNHRTDISDSLLREKFADFELEILIKPRNAEAKNGKDELKVSDFMSAPVRCVQADLSVHELSARLSRQMISGFPVVDSEQRLIGVVTRGDVVRALAAPFCRTDMPVSEIMTQYVITTTPQACLMEAVHLMLNFRLHRGIVVDEERRPVGIITTFDLVKVVQTFLNAEEDRAEERHLSAVKFAS